MRNKIENIWCDIEDYVGHKNCGRSIVTISAAHSFLLTAGFIKNSHIKEMGYTYVHLAFSKSKKAIVLTLAKNNNVNGAVHIKTQYAGRNDMRIHITDFFKKHNLTNACIVGKYEAELENIPGRGDSWVIYLDKKLI